MVISRVAWTLDREWLLTIARPRSLPDGVGLSLAMFGKIIRGEAGVVEMAVVRHEFRTRRAMEIGEQAVEDSRSCLASAAG